MAAQARTILGPNAFLGVEHAVLFESDPDRAGAIAREHLHPYLHTKYNIAKFRRLGYSEEEISQGGSDRIVDDPVFWGDLDTIVEQLHAHVDAGADHVAIQVIGIEPGQSTMRYWRVLDDTVLPRASAPNTLYSWAIRAGCAGLPRVSNRTSVLAGSRRTLPSRRRIHATGHIAGLRVPLP